MFHVAFHFLSIYLVIFSFNTWSFRGGGTVVQGRSTNPSEPPASPRRPHVASEFSAAPLCLSCLIRSLRSLALGYSSINVCEQVVMKILSDYEAQTCSPAKRLPTNVIFQPRGALSRVTIHVTSESLPAKTVNFLNLNLHFWLYYFAFFTCIRVYLRQALITLNNPH